MNGTEAFDTETGEATNLWALILFTFVVFGASGNLLVCVAILTERRLQNVTNYFLCSLAVADLLVSALVMPLAIMSEIRRGVWTYGIEFCIIFISLDVYLCSASIVHMAVISLDRYLGISQPFRSRNKSTSGVMLKIFAVWCVAALIASPITVLAIHSSSNIMLNNSSCQITNEHFQMYGTVVTFFIPCTIMVTTYVRTVHLLSRQAALCASQSNSLSTYGSAGLRRSVNRRVLSSTCSKASLYSNHTSPMNSLTPSPRLVRHSGTSTRHSFTPSTNSSRRQSRTLQKARKLSAEAGKSLEEDQGLTANWYRTSDMGNGSRSGRQPEPPRKLKLMRAATIFQFGKRNSQEQLVATEQKASKVLGIVFFCFIFCWAPFFMTNFTLALCGPQCTNTVPSFLFTLFLWLGYISSTLNPIIYTIFNKIFRQTFIRLLYCFSGRHRRFGRGTQASFISTVQQSSQAMTDLQHTLFALDTEASLRRTPSNRGN